MGFYIVFATTAVTFPFFWPPFSGFGLFLALTDLY